MLRFGLHLDTDTSYTYVRSLPQSAIGSGVVGTKGKRVSHPPLKKGSYKENLKFTSNTTRQQTYNQK